MSWRRLGPRSRGGGTAICLDRGGRLRSRKQLRGVGHIKAVEVYRNIFVLFKFASRQFFWARRLVKLPDVVVVRVVGGSRLLQGVTDVLYGDGLRRREELIRHAIVVGYLPAANLDPHIVSAASRDNREALARKLGLSRQLLLDGAKLFENAQGVGGQQLRHDAVNGIESKPTAGQLDLARRGDYVRLVAGVHHQRLAIDAHNRLKQGRYQTHCLCAYRHDDASPLGTSGSARIV